MVGYFCWIWNYKSGVKIFEYGKGKVIDIVEFCFENGEVILLIEYWGFGCKGCVLWDLYKLVCGLFGIVLGFELDCYYCDYFYFDIVNYWGGVYCW